MNYGINNALNDIIKTFCKKENVNTKDKDEFRGLDKWERNMSLDRILNNLPMLTGEQTLKLAMFPSDILKDIARTLIKSNNIISFAFHEQQSDKNGNITPATVTLSCTLRNGKTREFNFSDEVRNVQLNVKVPFHADYMKNDMLVGDLSDPQLFNAVIDCISSKDNPVIGYRQPNGAGTPAVETRLSEIQEFVLPTGEKMQRYELMESVAYDGEMFKNAVASKMLLQGLIANSNDGIFPVINQIINIYNIGILDENDDYTNAMRYAMKSLTAGYNNVYGIYEMPSTREIFSLISRDGIAEPYLLTEYNIINGISTSDSYWIDMDTFDVSYIHNDDLNMQEEPNAKEDVNEDVQL